jgi:hypothetical protein
VDIEFEDPPEAALLRKQPGRYVEFAIALREHQGKWAVLPSDEPRTEKGAQAAAQNLRRGVTKGFRKGEYDAVADGGKVYVKFLGPKPEAEEGEEGQEEGQEDKLDADDRNPELARQVRAWARHNGFDVPTRGRMPDKVWQAFYAARGKPESGS